MRGRWRAAVCWVLVLVLFGLGAAACRRPWQVLDPARARLEPEVAEWVTSMRNIYVGTSLAHGNYTYLLASWGLKDTGDYGVEITDVDLDGEEVVVTARWQEPAAPAAVEPHYPHALARVRRTDKPVRFVAEGDDQRWIPSLVGVPAGFQIRGPEETIVYSRRREESVEFGNILIGADDPGPVDPLRLTGIARVFEANVEYDLVGADDLPFGHGFVTAQSGAPEWGYFSIEIPSPAVPVQYVRVYTTSAKDGSIQDLVIVRPAD